jgi:hypothetical protein
VPALNQLYHQYKDRVEFFLVYIKEAHASDEWQLSINEKESVVYQDPRSYDERASLAATCSTELGIEFPALVDTIENTTETAYTGWPDRLYLIDGGGRIAYKSQAGPFGFKTQELSKALERVVSESE